MTGLTDCVWDNVSNPTCVSDDPWLVAWLEVVRDVGGEILGSEISLEGSEWERERPVQEVEGARVLIELYLGNVALD